MFLNSDHFKGTPEVQTFYNMCFTAPPDLNFFPHNICLPKMISALWKENIEYFRSVSLEGNSLSLRLDK